MIGLIFGVTFAICGVAGIMLGRSLSENDRAIAAWPRAAGKITYSQLEDVETSVRDSRGFYSRITVATPVIKFTYTAGGRELKGDQVSRFGMAFTKEPLSRYPVGQTVMVYYKPDDPTTAYLEAPESPSATVFTILGYAFVLIGIAAALGARFFSPTA